MLRVYKSSSVEWKPSAIVALATSVDGSQVAAARADGSLEIWLVSPGSVGWHCQLTIHGDPNSRVSSLVWCRPGSSGGSLGRLLSSNIDGSVSEWDCIGLKQKIVLDTIGVSIWQIAAESPNDRHDTSKHEAISENGHGIHSISSDTEEEEDSESEDDVDRGAVELSKQNYANYTRLAFACDDGCLRIYNVSDEEKLTYNRTLPRVGGRTLSVTWSPDTKRIYSGSSDGFIRCWDANLGNEIYRITVGLESVASQNDRCIWSLLALRCGTIVSGDSSGSVQFWDGKFGTLLQSNSYHKGDVNSLAAASSHDTVFSAGADGQVILYKLSSDAVRSNDVKFVPEAIKKWNYVGYVRSHTHDVRALAVAVPISHEADMQPDEKVKRQRSKKKPLDFSYQKWAHLGVPMLISAGDDTKLFAHSVNDFTKFSPHDICPAPQRMPMQLVLKKDKTDVNQTPLLLVQAAHCLDIYCVRLKNSAVSEVGPGPSGGLATTELVARVKCKATSKIVCSAISSSGTSFSYSDHLKPNLFELKRSKSDKNVWTVNKRKLPKELPFAHSIIYSSDSSQLLVAGHDRRIHVIDVENAKLAHVFTPCRKDYVEETLPSEPPITKMFTSTDGLWLAAANCFGDLYIFNLKTLRQHWFMSRMDGASVTAGGFSPRNSNILIITTSSNQVYALDVEAKQLGEGSVQHTFSLPRRYQEFPGDVIGLSFPLSSSSSSVIVYSARAMCFIDFGMPVEKENDSEKSVGKLKHSNGGLKRKARVHELETNIRKNFEICPFRDPVLFVEHVPKNSLLVIDKPWIQVVNNFEAQPVHRHIYGS